MRIPEPANITSENPDSVWARLPKAARNKEPGGRLCGLGRTTLQELGARGCFKIASIRQPGSLRAIHLVHLPSLRRYLDSLTEAQPNSELASTSVRKRSGEKKPQTRGPTLSKS
jgi:hypothetical protein